VSCDEIIHKQRTFDDTYYDLRTSIEHLHDKYLSSLDVDSGVTELSAILSECDSLRDRLDLMTSSFNILDTPLRRRHSLTTTSMGNLSSMLILSPSAHNHEMKAMLQQTKDEYDRLVQTLRSSKQTIESKQQRLQTLTKQYHDLEHEYQLLLTNQHLSINEEIIKDNQYEYKDECQRKRVRIHESNRSLMIYVGKFILFSS
jgi:DNA repair exonuclease SbcCD ATPase subunit